MCSGPNLLSGSRLALAPGLLALAWAGQARWFLAALAASLLSDLADGYLARKLGQTSQLGANLDSWGDLGTYAAAPLCVWWLWPDVVRREALFVVASLLSYAVPVLVGFAKYGRLTSYHTRGAKLSALLMAVGLALLLTVDAPLLFRIAVGVFAVAELEELCITALLPEWRADVPTLAHALRQKEPVRSAPGLRDRLSP